MNSNKSLSKLLASIITITPLIIVPFYYDYFYFPKIFFVYLVVSAMAIIWFLNRSNNILSIDFTEKMIIIYLVLMVISTAFSIDISRSIWGTPLREEGIITILSYIFIFVAAKRNFQFERKHLKLFLVSAIIVASYGVFQYFGYDPIPRDPFRFKWEGRAFSTMGNPNFLGTYLTLILPISTYAYVYSKKIVYLIVSGILYLSLLCTMTRSSWIGALISIVALAGYLIIYKYSIKHLTIILLTFMAITFFINIYSDGRVFGRFLTISNDLGSVIAQLADYESAGANRIFIWKRVIELIKQKPLIGYGLETLDLVFTDTYREDILALFNRIIIFNKAHNEYLHIAVSTGIPSLIAYLAFVWSIIRKAVKNAKSNPMIIPLLCSIIGYLVQAFFNISVVSVAYIYWIFLGILMKLSLEASIKADTEKLLLNTETKVPVPLSQPNPIA